MVSTDLKDIGIFAENLAELQIKAVEVPKSIKIPNWPKAAGHVRIKLGTRGYLYPIQTGETGMWRLVSKCRRLTFSVGQNGTFGFFVGTFEPCYEGTDDYSSLQRIRALVLFHQFKEEILLKIIQKLKADLGNHNQVVAMVEKAIEPFVPFWVADQLSS
jgi:hypothetical protein